MKADTHRAKVQSHLQEAERRGVNQTPTFVIGGKMIPGAIPYDTFKKLVDEELAKAPAAADTSAKGRRTAPRDGQRAAGEARRAMNKRMLVALVAVLAIRSLLAHDLTLADVAEALRKSNRNAGGGFLIHGDQQLIVRGVGYVMDPGDIKAVVLKNEGGTPVRSAMSRRAPLSHTPRRAVSGTTSTPRPWRASPSCAAARPRASCSQGIHARWRN